MTPAVATHPSDLFAAAVQSISAKAMADALACGKTHVYKQAAHPGNNEESRMSFIEKAERMLKAVADKNPVLAQTIADRFCRICGGKFVPTTLAKADKQTLLEELIDNVHALSEYTAVWQDPNSTIEDREEARRKLFEEINQDSDKSLR